MSYLDYPFVVVLEALVPPPEVFLFFLLCVCVCVHSCA